MTMSLYARWIPDGLVCFLRPYETTHGSAMTVFDLQDKADGMYFLLHGIVAIVSAKEELIAALHPG